MDGALKVTEKLIKTPVAPSPLGLLGAKKYTQALLAYPCNIGQVRQIVAAQLRRWGRAAVRDSVVLCLTEMLANVEKHAGVLNCVLCIEDLGPGVGVRLTVSDASQQVPVVRALDRSAEAGRGMRLIAATADNFGTTVTPTGKDVWAVFGRGAEFAA